MASREQAREATHAARNLLQILVSAVGLMQRLPVGGSPEEAQSAGRVLADAETRGLAEGARLLRTLEDVMEQPQLRVAIAEDDPLIRASLASQVSEVCGHAVVGQAETGEGMVELLAALKPDIAVFDIHMPPGRDGLSAFREGCKRAGILVAGVAVTGDPDAGLAERAAEEGLVLALLYKPVRPEQLRVAVMLAWARLRQMRLLQEEADSQARVLADRRTVEKAKWLLGRVTKADETECYKALQRAAAERHRRLADFAAAVEEGGEDGPALRQATAQLPDGHVHAAARRLVGRRAGHDGDEKAAERELRRLALAARLSPVNFGRRLLASDDPEEMLAGLEEPASA